SALDDLEMARGGLAREANRVAAGEAGDAVATAVLAADGAGQALEGEIADGVGGDVAGDLVEGVGGGDELLPVRRVDAVEAGPDGGRAGDAQVDLACASRPQHLDDLAAGGSTDDGVVDHHDALAPQHVGDGAELEAHAEVPDRLGGLDEGSAHVVAAHQAQAEGDAAFLGVPDRRRDARVGNRD